MNLSEPGTGKLWDDPTEYITVKMTFDSGVGDTPDDYYILYIDPKNYRLRAAELTVTYADVLPPDVDVMTEIIVYEEVRYSGWTYGSHEMLYLWQGPCAFGIFP